MVWVWFWGVTLTSRQLEVLLWCLDNFERADVAAMLREDALQATARRGNECADVFAHLKDTFRAEYDSLRDTMLIEFGQEQTKIRDIMIEDLEGEDVLSQQL